MTRRRGLAVAGLEQVKREAGGSGRPRAAVSKSASRAARDGIVDIVDLEPGERPEAAFEPRTQIRDHSWARIGRSAISGEGRGADIGHKVPNPYIEYSL